MRHLKLASVTAMLLGVAAVPAAQASTSMLSLQRASTAGGQSSELTGGVAIIGIAAVAIIGSAIYVATDDDDDEESDSN